MEVKDAIKQLLKDHRKTQEWLAEQLGLASQSGVSVILSANNPMTSTLLDICDSLDYELSIQPKRRAGKRPDGQIIIDGAKGRKLKRDPK